MVSLSGTTLKLSSNLHINAHTVRFRCRAPDRVPSRSLLQEPESDQCGSRLPHIPNSSRVAGKGRGVSAQSLPVPKPQTADQGSFVGISYPVVKFHLNPLSCTTINNPFSTINYPINTINYTINTINYNFKMFR